jgi:hypothetical protein
VVVTPQPVPGRTLVDVRNGEDLSTSFGLPPFGVRVARHCRA